MCGHDSTRYSTLVAILFIQTYPLRGAPYLEPNGAFPDHLDRTSFQRQHSNSLLHWPPLPLPRHSREVPAAIRVTSQRAYLQQPHQHGSDWGGTWPQMSRPTPKQTACGLKLLCLKTCEHRWFNQSPGANGCFHDSCCSEFTAFASSKTSNQAAAVLMVWGGIRDSAPKYCA